MIPKRIKSFGYAIRGIFIATKEEANFRIHLVATAITITLGCYFQISPFDWKILILTVGFVLVTELINTAIENLCDHVTHSQHDLIKKIKDISAAAVLVAALSALIIGVFIFYPYLKDIY